MRTSPSYRAVIDGKVQGLGFRPYVYRLALSMGVAGTVANTHRGVEIVAQGKRAREFLSWLRQSPPPLARIARFAVSRIRAPRLAGFSIKGSTGRTPSGIEVLPDLATCQECRNEFFNPKDRRFSYPFTNCTQCGPRYTIIESLPYDRPRTTMRSFRMCPDCSREYRSPLDRRFHAQPNACSKCGPALRLLKPNGTGHISPIGPIGEAARATAAGRIVAIKSLGGFQLACDATSNRAVRRLRQRKDRPAKPLALMCDCLATARRFCRVSRTEAALLLSPAAPIVLVSKSDRSDTSDRSDRIQVSALVAPGNSRYGVMLPYTPLHLLLFRELRRTTGRPVVLVMTSANRRDAPITATDRELLAELGNVVDLVLTHNRPIANRCDDSVVMAVRPGLTRQTDNVLPVRIARGYAPVAVRLAPMFHVKHPTLAVGGDMRNTFCLAAGDRAFVGPHIGDMDTARAERFFRETLGRLVAWTGIQPEKVACDLHPDYFSTRLAERLARRWRIPLVRVQHHYAHTISVMAEHGLSGRVLGVALDGTGYGTDGAIWGCEFVLVEPDMTWQRVGHLEYLWLPASGDAVPNPSRIAAAYAVQASGTSTASGKRRSSALVGGYPGSVQTSSLGRLFDAAAGLTGVCRRATFDGQAPMALEAAASDALRRTRYVSRRNYGLKRHVFHVERTASGIVIDPKPIIRLAVGDIGCGLGPGAVAARFHDAVGRALAAAAQKLARTSGAKAVALSGGAVQNDLLRGQMLRLLSRRGLTVRYNNTVPVNDGGISLGQAVAVGRGD